MLSHKAGLLTVSFNEGGGMNVVTATGYDETDEKRMERVVNAYMSVGRTIDLLLLFQTARVLNEYLDIKNERVAYVSLVRDILQYNDTSEEHFEIFNKKKRKPWMHWVQVVSIVRHPAARRTMHKKTSPRIIIMTRGPDVEKEGGLLLSRIALQYHRRRRA